MADNIEFPTEDPNEFSDRANQVVKHAEQGQVKNNALVDKSRSTIGAAGTASTQELNTDGGSYFSEPKGSKHDGQESDKV